MNQTPKPEIPEGLFGKPILRTAANETETHRKATWLDLFFDLFFVAAIGTISHMFSHAIGHRTRGFFIETIIYITAVWRLWSSITYFFERYKTQGLTKRLFMFVQMFLIAGMVLTITGGPEVSQIFFLIYGIAKGLLAAMYLRANTGNKDAHYCKNNLLQVYGNSAVLIASIVALFLPGERAGRILLGALAVDLLIPYLGRATLKYLAPSFETDTYSERFGLFIIIVLGESVLGAVTGVEREQLSGINLTLIAGALMLSFVYRWLYFEYVSQATIIKKHILKRTYLHLPLTIFFTLISALIVYLIEYGQTIESRLPAILLILSCIGVMITMIWFEQITGSYSRFVDKKPQFVRHMIIPSIIMALLIPSRGLSIQAILRLIVGAAMIPMFIRARMITQAFQQAKEIGNIKSYQ